MEWKDVAQAVGKFAPLVGSALGGKAGEAIGGLVSAILGVDNTPDAVNHALTVDPDAAVKLRQIEKDQRVELQALAVTSAQNVLAADTARIQIVNATMQAETASDHWPSYTWRPFIGFITGTMVFGVYFVLPLAKIPVPSVPETVWLMLGGILGIASWYRGKMQADPNIPTDNKG